MVGYEEFDQILKVIGIKGGIIHLELTYLLKLSYADLARIGAKVKAWERKGFREA